VFSVIYAGYVTDMQHYLVKVDHYYFGWVLFALLLLPVIFISRRFQPKLVTNTDIHMGEEKQYDDFSGNDNLTTIILGMVVGLMALTALSSAIKMDPFEPGNVHLEAPDGSSSWVIVEGVRRDWLPDFIGAEKELMKDYSDGSNIITLYLNMYTNQSQGEELIGFKNHIEGIDKWKIDKSTRKTIELKLGIKLDVRKLILKSKNNKRRIIYYWYEINSHRVVTDLHAKIWQGITRLVDDSRAGIIAVSTECESDECTNAQLNLNSWLDSIWMGSQQGNK